jgi:hypothetical protein
MWKEFELRMAYIVELRTMIDTVLALKLNASAIAPRAARLSKRQSPTGPVSVAKD